jgi:hypothetical protein
MEDSPQKKSSAFPSIDYQITSIKSKARITIVIQLAIRTIKGVQFKPTPDL